MRTFADGITSAKSASRRQRALTTAVRRGLYLAGSETALAAFSALELQRPPWSRGRAGVGKTNLARALAEALGRPLFGLQCYEGLDAERRQDREGSRRRREGRFCVTEAELGAGDQRTPCVVSGRMRSRSRMTSSLMRR